MSGTQFFIFFVCVFIAKCIHSAKKKLNLFLFKISKNLVFMYPKLVFPKYVLKIVKSKFCIAKNTTS